MSNVIEYEYVTGGPLKGEQPASKGGRMLPPPTPPPLNETLLGVIVSMKLVQHCIACEVHINYYADASAHAC